MNVLLTEQMILLAVLLFEGTPTEQVSQYKYFGFILDDDGVLGNMRLKKNIITTIKS